MPVRGVPPGLAGVVVMRVEVTGDSARFIAFEREAGPARSGLPAFTAFPDGRVFEAETEVEGPSAGDEQCAANGETPVGEAPAAT
jgi:hypothetical protein